MGSTSPQFYVRGTTYLPKGWVNMDLTATQLTMQGGIVARRFDLGDAGRADPV